LKAPSRKLQWAVFGLLGVIFLCLVVAVRFRHGIGGRFLARLKAPPRLPVLLTVPPFSLTNQAGDVVTLEDLRDQNWLADIIFTRCAGPCPEMTRKMADLQRSLPQDTPLRFVTLTTDPAYDTPAVLGVYSRKFEAQPGRWHFLTGSKKQIADLAVKGLKLTALDKEESARQAPEDLFVHSTLFVLVDRRSRVRGVFESDDPEMKTKVFTALDTLLRER
jgi:protein SCO1/2